ncbi:MULTISPECIES: hypothetical protein [Kytococcus]|nr:MULTISPECIES: hypothetical protein [Kytococcus]
MRGGTIHPCAPCSGGHTDADVRAILLLAVALLATDLTNTLLSNGGLLG